MYIVCGQQTMTQKPPTLRIDLSARTPAYEQIAAAVRATLVAGDLHPGDRLPTVRELAIDLGVHHNTVAEAYRVLAAEGWVDLRRRRGAEVLARQSPVPSARAQTDLRRQLRELAAKALSDGLQAADIVTELEAVKAMLAGEGIP
jgi:GntR family transcriptional regulator